MSESVQKMIAELSHVAEFDVDPVTPMVVVESDGIGSREPLGSPDDGFFSASALFRIAARSRSGESRASAALAAACGTVCTASRSQADDADEVLVDALLQDLSPAVTAAPPAPPVTATAPTIAPTIAPAPLPPVPAKVSQPPQPPQQEIGPPPAASISIIGDILGRPPSFDETPLPPSQLTSEQQRRFLSLSMKERAGSSLIPQERAELLSLEATVVMEREKFHQHFFKFAFSLFLSIPPQISLSSRSDPFFQSEALENQRCLDWISPANERKIEELLRRKRDDGTKHPRFFKQHCKFDISKRSPADEGAMLKYEWRVFESGTCPLYERPSLPCDLSVIPSTQRAPLPLIREDKVINEWVSRNPANVAIPASSFVTMFDMWPPRGMQEVCSFSLLAFFRLTRIPPSKEWTIPFAIRSNGKGDKTAMFEKPLLKHALTPREKNAVFFKAALTSAVTQGAKSGITLKAGDPALREKLGCGKKAETRVEPGATGVTYNLWMIGRLHVLIRCRVNASEKSLPTDAADTLPLLGIRPKLHYCTAGGRREMATEREIARWGLRTILHPSRKSKLVIGESSPHTP